MASCLDNTALQDVVKSLCKCCKCDRRPLNLTGKLLPCGHVMCISCLQSLEKKMKRHNRDRQSSEGCEKKNWEISESGEETATGERDHNIPSPNKATCPDCSKTFYAQNPELSNLQSVVLDTSLLHSLFRTNIICEDACLAKEENNRAEFFCSECNGWMCEGCSKTHKQMTDTSVHTVMTSEVYQQHHKESSERCPIHNEHVRVFCCESSCQIPVCMLCLTVTHAGHKTTEFSEATEIIRKRLLVLRKVNKRRQESLADSKQQLQIKLDDERTKFAEAKQHIESKAAYLKERLETMCEQVNAKCGLSMDIVNSDYIVSLFVDRLIQNVTRQDIGVGALLSVSRLIKSNKHWFSENLSGSEQTNPLALTIGVVDPANDLLSSLSSDPTYKALLEPNRSHLSPGTGILQSLTISRKSSFTIAHHFVPEEITSYLAKAGEELSQLSVKDTTILSNNDLGLLVCFYSSAYGWENGILVLSNRNPIKTYKCKRAFSVRYLKHCYCKIAAYGSTHLLLVDDANRCMVTYTVNGKEVSVFNFSPHEVPKHVQVKDNRLIVSFRQEMKAFVINIVGELDGTHKMVFILYQNFRGFEKEHVLLEDPHFTEYGEILVRGFVYPESTTRVRDDPVFLNYRIYLLDETKNRSGKLQFIACADMYGINNISLSPDGDNIFASDYNQNMVLQVPIRRAGKRTNIDTFRSSCALSALDGIDKLKAVSVDRYGDLVVVESNDVKIFKKTH